MLQNNYTLKLVMDIASSVHLSENFDKQLYSQPI